MPRPTIIQTLDTIPARAIEAAHGIKGEAWDEARAAQEQKLLRVCASNHFYGNH
jgi:hypothetical protein